MSIATESIVTVYSDTMAFFLVFGLYLMFKQYRVGRDEKADKIFNFLCIMTMINAVSDGISYALHHQVLDWPQPIRLLAPTIAEYTTLIVLFVWTLYIDYKLYESWDHLKTVARFFSPPVLIYGALCVINLFWHIVFYMTDDMLFVARPMFMVMMIFQYMYGVFPVLAVIHHVRLHGNLHFFHIMPVVVPVVIASLFTLVTPYSARAFGFAAALVMLHFSYISKWRFDDVESGFYNRSYVEHIIALARDGKRDYHGALAIEADHTNKDFFEILRNELPKDGELIRMEANRFVMFIEGGGRSVLTLLSQMLNDAVSEGTEDDPIRIIVSTKSRKKNESSMDFVRAVCDKAS